MQQEKLKQSEQRFQALVEWSPYAALVHREMTITYVNPAAVKLFGATSEQDLIGTPVLRWHHPDYHQIVLERIRKANVEGVAAPIIESKYFKLDGSIMDLEVQGKPIIYDGLPSILATFNDVTEHRRVEHQLSERLKEIETLFFLSKLSGMQDLSLNALCQELTDYLPNGWQYPEIACSRILIDEVEFRSENFEDSAFLLSAPVKANSITNGRIEVAYLKEMPKADEGPFLKEERVLINALAQQLGTVIDRKNAEEKRKEAEIKLIKSEDRFDKISENNKVITWETNADGLYTYISDVCKPVMGYEPQDVIEKLYFYEFFPEEEREALKEAAFAFFERKEPFRGFENAIETKDKKIIWVSTNAMPILNDNGQLTGYRGTDVDITIRKQLEEELKRTSTRLNLATIAGGVGTWEYDLFNDFLLWDDHMFKLYGLDKKNFNVTFETWRSCVHPDDNARVYEEIQMATQNIKEFDTEFQIIWPDGTVRHIRAIAVVQFDSSGKALSLIGTNWDITNQKNLQLALLKSSEILQINNAEKDKFFSIIAHDLRGPFHGFLGLTQYLVEESESLSSKEILRFSSIMKDSASNLFNLLENLLEWARLHQEKINFKPEPILLMPNVEECILSLLDSANKKKIVIKTEIPPNLEISADKYMLDSIIRNLLSNAVKFTDRGGEIILGSKILPGKLAEIFVRDSGIGMDNKMMDNLFRIDVPTSRKGTENEPSTGLGLILCKDFVEKHNGKLWVQSEEGKGSVFYFTLPSNAEDPTKSSLSNTIQAKSGKLENQQLKILIVEDDEISGILISSMVKKYCREIIHTKNGVDTIKACHNNPDIDLILMDIQLPGIDGYEVTRQIRQFNKEVIIIAQTAYAFSYEREKSETAGCNDYIPKPILKAELLKIIRKHI